MTRFKKFMDAYSGVREAAKERQREAGEQFGRGQEKVREQIPEAIAPWTRDVRAQAAGKETLREQIPEVFDSLWNQFHKLSSRLWNKFHKPSLPRPATCAHVVLKREIFCAHRKFKRKIVTAL